MITINSFNIDQTVSSMLDGFAIVILGVIIISSLTFESVKMKKLRHILLYCAFFGIVASVIDIVCQILLGQTGARDALFRYSQFASLALFVFLSIKANFILCYLDDRKGSNRVFKILVGAFAFILATTTIIPTIYSLIFQINDSAQVQAGPLTIVYSAAIAMLELTSFAAIIVNRARVPFKNFFTLALFQILPVSIYFIAGRKSAPAFFLMSIFLLFSYIILFQVGTLNSYKQEAKLALMNAENKDMRTKLVVSQIQPHFLYNTLSSIAYYCKKDPEVAQNLTLSFSNYLRNNIDSLDGEKAITFNQELDHVKTYLEIEQIRFGDRVHVEYDIGYDHFTLPSLVIQPIVENAVKHGICKKEEGGTVLIHTEKNDSEILIIISDNGVGFDLDGVKKDDKNHVGIANVNERLKTFCNGRMEIVSSKGNGTTVTIHIPLEVNQ